VPPPPPSEKTELIERDARGAPLLTGPHMSSLSAYAAHYRASIGDAMDTLEDNSAAEVERSMIGEMYREYAQRYDVDGAGKSSRLWRIVSAPNDSARAAECIGCEFE
jgi:hypothetical protein